MFLCRSGRIEIGGMVARQEVAFSEECRKIKGCGSLREGFYTRFIPIFKDFGLWHGGKKEWHFGGEWLLPECYFGISLMSVFVLYINLCLVYLNKR